MSISISADSISSLEFFNQCMLEISKGNEDGFQVSQGKAIEDCEHFVFKLNESRELFLIDDISRHRLNSRQFSYLLAVNLGKYGSMFDGVELAAFVLNDSIVLRTQIMNVYFTFNFKFISTSPSDMSYLYEALNDNKPIAVTFVSQSLDKILPSDLSKCIKTNAIFSATRSMSSTNIDRKNRMMLSFNGQ